MDFFKGEEQVARYGVAVAVLEDYQPAAILGGCPYLGDLGVSAHENHIAAGSGNAFLEVVSLLGRAL